MGASASLHVLIQNASFFLAPQVPIFSTPITGARIVPIGSRALYQVFHKQAYTILHYTGSPQTKIRGFFYEKGLHLSKSKDIFFLNQS